MNSEKNILFMLHLPPPVHGAAMVGRFIRESELINRSFNSHYINISSSQTVDEIGESGFGKWKRIFSIVVKSCKAILHYKPQLVYFTLSTTGIGLYKDALLVLVLKLFGKKIVYHLHNKGVRNNSMKRLNRWIYQFVFSNTDVILLSKRLYNDIEKYVLPDRVFVCPNGIPVVDDGEITSINYSLDEIPKILFLSNLIESKGVWLLLEACAILNQKGTAFECNFIGAPGDISEIGFNKKVGELKLQHKVNFLNARYGSEKYKAFLNHDLFVFPTFYDKECFPLVILEAMQFSLPIITSSEGGIPDIVLDSVNGIILNDLNSANLAEAIEDLIRNPETRKRMGERGFDLFKEKYTLKKFESNFTSTLKKILN